MQTIAVSIGVAIAVLIVMPLLVRAQTRKLAGIEGLLRESGPLTFDEIVKRLETGVFARGYLMQALEKKVADGTLQKLPPPAGTPRLRIFRETRYTVAAA